MQRKWKRAIARKAKAKNQKKPEYNAEPNEPSFVLTLPLITRPFQEHRLHTAFEVSRKIYNACLGELYRRYNAMIGSSAYQQVIKKAKDIPERSQLIQKLQRNNKITEYAMHVA